MEKTAETLMKRDNLGQLLVSPRCREKFVGRRNLMVTLNFHLTSFTAKSEFQMTTTEQGFHLKSGFRKIV